MPKRPTKSDEYEVGYGKPPRHSQFQPGQSGNPKGRPRGRETFHVLMEKCLNKTTRVKLGGEIKSVPVREAVVMNLVQQMLHGPPHHTVAILKFILPSLETSPKEIPIELVAETLEIEEIDALEMIMTKLQAAMERKGGQ